MADYKNPVELRKLAEVMNQKLAKDALFEAADEIERLLMANKVISHIGVMNKSVATGNDQLSERVTQLERELRDMNMQIEGLKGQINHR